MTMKSSRRLMLLVSMALCVDSSVARANNYGWYPSSPLFLGATFDPDRPNDAKVPCLNTDGSTAPVDSGAPSTEFRSSIITERKDVYQIFSVSASLAASYVLASGSASMSSTNEIAFDSESIVWAMTAKSNYGRTALTNVALKDEYASLPAATIKAICGSDFIVMDRREAVAAAFFTFHSTSSRTRQQLRTALSASWVGGDFSANLNSALKQAVSQTEITFTFIAKGGDGLVATKGLVTSFDKFDEVRAQVAAYIGTMDRTKAPAAEYFSTPLPMLVSSAALTDVRERPLSLMWNDFLRFDQISKEAARRLQNISSYWYLDATILRTYLAGIARDANQKVTAITNAAVACTADRNRCEYSPYIDEYGQIEWPSIEPVARSGGYSCDVHRRNGRIVQGSNCNGESTFLVRIQGPGKPDSIQGSRVLLTFPSREESFGYNCDYKPRQVTAEGIELTCSTGMDLFGFNKNSIDIRIHDRVTGAEALRSKFVDTVPDFIWPQEQ